VQGVSRVFLQEYASACLLEMEGEDRAPEGPEALARLRTRREAVIQDMIALLDKAP